MTQLGFKYEPRKKGYYVDGHEKPATVAYRWSFCQWYLEYKQHMHHWVRTPAACAKELEDNGELMKGNG